METAQQLYDLAFQYWEAQDYDKAKEYINKALKVAPDDFSLNVLAMHIHRWDYKEYDFIQYAEFIVDHNIHYNDTLEKLDDPHDFLAHLVSFYTSKIHDAEQEEKKDKSYTGINSDSRNIAERAYDYAKRILQAGYGVKTLDDYIEILNKTERYDETIEIGQYVLNRKSAVEIGLPGVDLSEKDGWEEVPIKHLIMDAYFLAGRNEEALLWCREYITQHPDDCDIHFLMGEVLCRINRPEDTARQWIIGLQNGENASRFNDVILYLSHMVADKDFNKKYMLYHRLITLEDTIPADRKPLFNKIKSDISGCVDDPEEKIIEESYIEGTLKIKLPPVKKENYFYFDRLWLPKKQGPHPYLPPDPARENTDDSDQEITSEAVIPKTLVLKPYTIERLGIDITEQVRSKKHPPVVGRDREIDALIRILIRMEKNNPVLLGDAGVGKTAIILGLAQRIIAENVPVYLRGKRIIELPMSALVGGTMWRGDFETRITDIVNELRENTDIILFVDELHTIMGAGAADRGDLDVANIIKPALAKGEIRLVGATTNHEYSLYIERDQAMARRFTPVRVAEMDRNATLQVLKHRVDFWREHHKVNVPEKTLIYAIDLTEYQMRHRRFPDKAIDLLDESCAYISISQKTHDGEYLSLSTDHVNHVFREWTGTVTDQPEEIKQDKDKVSTDNIEREQIKGSLQKHVVAQTKVIDQLTTLALHIRHAVKDPILPFVLLFHGQPGTGKTTAASAMAQTLWPSEQDRVMVLNMAEYSDPFAYDRLVGGPPGYAGYNEEGILSARIKRKPFSIVILKNIGEAHPQVINFFGSLFRIGVFTDKRGQEILAGDILFIIHFDVKTTTGTLGFTSTKTDGNMDDSQALDMLKKYGVPSTLFKVYFQVFQFHDLTKPDMNDVLNIHIEKLKNKYAQKGITLTFTNKIQKQLTDRFYEMPGEKRNMEILIDQFIIPKLRDKMLKSKTKTIKKITID